jgi:hypothetical protein
MQKPLDIWFEYPASLPHDNKSCAERKVKEDSFLIDFTLIYG